MQLTTCTVDNGQVGVTLLAWVGYLVQRGAGVGGTTPRHPNGGCGTVGEIKTSITGHIRRPGFDILWGGANRGANTVLVQEDNVMVG